jgi:hypothetical protein
MAQEKEPINAGESPLATGSQSIQGATSTQVQSGANQLDGGPAPFHAGGELQQHAAQAEQGEAGVAASGGIVRPLDS